MKEKLSTPIESGMNEVLVGSITQKFSSEYVELPTRIQKAEEAGWPLMKADVIVFISDPSVPEGDRNIKVSCMVPPKDIEKTISAEIKKILSARKYERPVVDSVSIETSGHDADGTEIHGGGIYRSLPTQTQ